MVVYVIIGLILLSIVIFLVYDTTKTKNKNIGSDVIEIEKFKNYQFDGLDCKAVIQITDQNTKKVKYVYNPMLKKLILIGNSERLISIKRVYIDYIK